jgi:hypothetical protein
MTATSLDYNSMMQANLARVFRECDASRRTKAIAELYANDATLYEPDAEAKGHAAINRAVEALLSHLPPQFAFSDWPRSRSSRYWQAALASRTAKWSRSRHRHGCRAFRWRTHPLPLRLP